MLLRLLALTAVPFFAFASTAFAAGDNAPAQPAESGQPTASASTTPDSCPVPTPDTQAKSDEDSKAAEQAQKKELVVATTVCERLCPAVDGHDKKIVGYRTIQAKGRQHKEPVYADGNR